MSAIGEGQKLRHKLTEPRGVLGKIHVANLDLGRLGSDTFELAALGANGDRSQRSWGR
jgi:hypothetical protein